MTETKTKQYERPLHLVTPHMRSQAVRDAQWLLSGHSRFEGLSTYKDGKPDGDYGLLTAQAVKRAKFWLGYPLFACDTSFGQTLYEYLRPEHWRPLPDAYRETRAARLREAARVTPGASALKYAETQVGYHEEPFGSNHNKYGVWYGWDRVAWCAIFESYCMAHSRKQKPSFRYASVEMIYHDAAALRNGLTLIRTPRYGDIVCLTVHGDPFAHTSFFVKDLGGGRFQDLGGNTGPTNISNGGAVMRQTRHYSAVSHFVRVS